MDDYDCVLLSGGSGAIGAFIARQLLETSDRPLISLLHSPASLQRLEASLGEASARRINPIFVDLTAPDQVEVAADKIAASGRYQRCLAIHCAAEVSWTKSERLVGPINIDGTRHFAELAIRCSHRTPSFVFFSTAFCNEEHEPRNAYERSKRTAERMLETDFSDRLNLAILKCSLVVGASSDGWMPRFNGLYPLIRVLALAEVPCLIADPKYRLDTTPVDFVWRQVQAAARRLADDGKDVLRLVAAAGPKALSIGDVAQVAVGRVDDARREAGLPPLPPISVIAERQFRFLMKSSRSWNLEKRFAKVEEISRVMAGYIVHGGSGRDLQPITLDEPVPDPRNYLPTVIDYWISAHRPRVLRLQQPEWLVPEPGSPE